MRVLCDRNINDNWTLQSICDALKKHDSAFDFFAAINELGWRRGPLEILASEELANAVDACFNDIFLKGTDFPESRSVWMRNIRTNRDRAYFRTRHSLSESGAKTFLRLLEAIEDIIRDQLIKLVEQHFYHDRIPRAGGLLYFTSNVQFCLIVQYEVLSGGGVLVQIVDAIEEPSGILELDSITNSLDSKSASFTKSLISSGYKIVIHNNALTCVDRRTDRNVFGPTIDTLVLAQLVATIKGRPPDSILEVGTGSGAILSSCLTNIPKIRRAYGYDVSMDAIASTYKNIRGNLPSTSETAVSLILGDYARSEVIKPTGIDLLISNPPYIPDFDDGGSTESLPFGTQSREATLGTSVILAILSSLDGVLSEDGRALIMLSSVCHGEIAEFVRTKMNDFQMEPALPSGSIDVPFDVETVVGRPNIIDKFVAQKKLSIYGGKTYHKLIPVWIKRRRELTERLDPLDVKQLQESHV